MVEDGGQVIELAGGLQKIVIHSVIATPKFFIVGRLHESQFLSWIFLLSD